MKLAITIFFILLAAYAVYGVIYTIRAWIMLYRNFKDYDDSDF